MGLKAKCSPSSYHTWQNPKVPSFACTMGFFAKSFLWSFGVSAFAEYGGLRGGVETIDTNVSEAAPRGLSSCGLFKNHWGSKHEEHDNVESSCDCKTMCDDKLWCRAWTHNFTQNKCVLRNSYSYEGQHFGYTDVFNHGVLSGEAPTCGIDRNHYGTVLEKFDDVDRSCDCRDKCDNYSSCEFWTHDGSKTCYLRNHYSNGYTRHFHVYGMTSGRASTDEEKCLRDGGAWYRCTQHSCTCCIPRDDYDCN